MIKRWNFNVYNQKTKKMSKSSESEKGVIRLLDDVNSARKKIMSATTDSEMIVKYDEVNKPGITNLLNFVHTLDINKSIVVIGQAGERDYLKRPKVGNAVVNNASYAIFTYEDPRSEDPKDICNDIISELKDTHDNYEIVIDRHEAIEKAIMMAKEKDMVLVLGKGNETYQKLLQIFNIRLVFEKHLESSVCVSSRESLYLVLDFFRA